MHNQTHFDMDYKKLYDKALELTRQKYEQARKDNNPIYCIYEEIFPELRESEDERIMKKMIEHFKSKTKDTWCNMPVKSILDWLEKQKVLTEHKEGIYYYYRDGTFTFISSPAVENPHNFTVPKPNEKPVDYDHEMWKNCEANFEGGKKEVIDHPEKYGLQKPAEWSEVELEFRGEKVTVKRQFYRDNKGRGYSTAELDEEVAWNALRAWCEKKGISLYDLYPKVEWSEEDEEMVRFYENDYDNNLGNMPMCDVIENRIKFKDWLLNRLSSLRPSWKPSGELLEALHTAAYLPEMEFYGGLKYKLRELYEHLFLTSRTDDTKSC